MKSIGSKLRAHKLLIAILLLALCARLSVVFIFSDTILGARVEKSHTIAKNFLEGKGFSFINKAYSEDQVLYAHGRPFYVFFGWRSTPFSEFPGGQLASRKAF